MNRPLLSIPSLLALGLAACGGDDAAQSDPTDAMVTVDAACADAFDGTRDASNGMPDASDGMPDTSLGLPDPIAEMRTPDEVDVELAAHCAEAIGPARVEALADDLHVAIGYDLASTISLTTPAGRVVFDVGMSPARAEVARAALDEVAPGPVAAIVYTHSHIDHVGGASVWAEDDTAIWATDRVTDGIIEQYGAYRPSETRRGSKQFGRSVPDEALPCSALGKRVDLDAALVSGVRFPTDSFADAVALDFGGVTVELYRAPGETDDQLFAWIPHLGALLPGDNWYAAFPNLYTIRGTTPRDVERWIASLDAMRRLDPEVLVPSHTAPIVGREAVRAALTAHRDAIAWVYTRVVRAANAGLDIDGVATSAALPAHLAAVPTLAEMYGQVDWSARAIYGHGVGWFDGRATTLYPPVDAAAREVQLMGGTGRVLAAARAAQDGGDPRFALHLLDKLERAGAEVPADLAAAARVTLAARVANTNGRAWLLEEAEALVGEVEPPGEVVLDDALLDAVPIDALLRVLPTRLRAEQALDRHVALALNLGERRYVLTVRRGIAEVVEGDPLPGTPPVAATLVSTEGVFVRIALGVLGPAEALAQELLQVDDLGAAVGILALFDAG